MMRSRRLCGPAALLAGAILVVTAGCGQGELPAAAPPEISPLSAHKSALSSGANCAGTDVHQKHINAFACSTCHPAGATFGFGTPYAFPGGTTTAGGTITPHTATTPTTCTVACHFPKGAQAKSITWITPGPLACTECHATAALPTGHPAVSANATRADCQRCHLSSGHMDGTVTFVAHDASWMDQASQQFHAFSANADLPGCQSCHGQDLGGGVVGVSCAQCHDVGLPAGVASWKVSCAMCHGGTDSTSGAPPVATWGNSGDPIRVGAHTAHSGSAIAPAIACAVCHATPADALSEGHMDGGTAEVTFGGIAAAGAPTWDRSIATCAVYCHGATLNAGGTNTAPSWTGGPAQAACGTCHGTPPPAPHPVASGLASCAGCHPDTVDASGVVIAPTAGGKHLDGVVESAGGHDAAWMDTASTGFHAYSANSGLAGCTTCHGADLGGGSARACAACHDGAQASLWGTCTTCHGGTDNTTGAPPRATWGNRAVAGVANIRIGVHSTHVSGTASSRAVGCEVCHVEPASALEAGHADAATASVVFSGVAAQGTTPIWNRTAATCASTYCHGSLGGTVPAPVWTQAGGMGCSACHRSPPADTNHSNAHWGLPCSLCHPGYTSTSAASATHVNGVKNVTNPATGTPWTSGWSDCGSCHSY